LATYVFSTRNPSTVFFPSFVVNSIGLNGRFPDSNQLEYYGFNAKPYEKADAENCYTPKHPKSSIHFLRRCLEFKQAALNRTLGVWILFDDVGCL